MSTLLLRQSAFNNLTDKQERLIKLVADRVDLGEPAVYTAPPNTRWLVWDDDRFSFRDFVAFGVFATLRAQIETQITEDETVRDNLRAWLESRLDLTEPPVDEENPLQWALDNNGTPQGMRAAFNVPGNWIPFSA